MKTSGPLFSHHIFLFPFKWIPPDVNLRLHEQTALESIDRLFIQEIKSDLPAWRKEAYKIDTLVNYNEYNYFFDYVREVIYDTQGKEASPLYSHLSGSENMLRHYTYAWDKDKGHGYYKIQVNDPKTKKKENKKKTYELEIDSILLQFYYTGVGILSFHLNNRSEDQSSKEDILWINQFGRRLYPPFFRIPQDKVGKTELDDYGEFASNLPTGIELAHSISLKIPGKKEISECWKSYEEYKNFKATPFLLPAFIEELLPEAFRKEKEKEASPLKQKFDIIPALDDRMFVVSWYGNDRLARGIYGARPRKEHIQLKYLSDDWWFKYVFVDTGSLSCENEVMQKDLIQAATNGRWAKYGTLYGVTDYSFVLLSSTIESLGGFAFVVNHMQTMYYKLAELVLLQRASVQRFSDEVTHISQLNEQEKTREKKNETLADKVSSLYMLYIRFVNKIFFREVTAQIQGVELYRLLQSQCRIEKLVKDLDGEINELHHYVLQRQEKQRNERLETLTVLGAIFLAPSLIFGLYGVSILNGLPRPCLNLILPVLAGITIIIAILSWLAFGKRKNRVLRFLFFVIMTGALFSPVVVVNLPICKIIPVKESELKRKPEQENILPPSIPLDTVKTNFHE